MISQQRRNPCRTINSDRWQRLKGILSDALEKESPATRAAAVVQLCDGDADLLGQAESLLIEAEALLREAHDDLEDCANNASAGIRPEDGCEIGERVGAYLIVRKIGEGGMGTVYLAARADGYFEKQVAIKVLRRGSDSEEVLRRFQSEREVLARLDHPNIARLIDAGTTADGLPYLVMEYVDGTAVTRFVVQNCASIADRLNLFIKMSDAVAAAHRNSVIHCDLKPTNILVNRDGEPKLLDFGIAKLIGNPKSALELTALGQCRFTPISASPEQAKGERVTVASDVYALGAVLYELLTETRPLRFATLEPSRRDVVHAVCEQPPLPPSSVAKDRETQRALRGDLDAIVLRALQKDPASRYISVAHFTEDIRRYLAGKPVHAREAEPTYRIRNFLFQNRWLQLGVVSACIALLGVGALFLRPVFRKHPSSENIAGSSIDEGISGQVIPEKSIAILPFDSLTPDGENSYFADGVQDDVLTALANARELKVISRTSVTAYRQNPKDLGKIRDDLKVAYVLEGTAQKFGDRIRVNARLIDTRTQSEVWAEAYDRKLDDLFAVQSELAQAIVSQLKGKLSAGEKAAIESRPTADTLAYDLYLQARESFFQSNWQNAVHLLDSAIARDRHFALAYYLLAEVRLYLYRFDRDRTPERLDQARQAAEMALKIAPQLPQSHLAKAQYYYYGLRDYEAAQKELRAVASPSADQAKFVDLTALTERRLGHWKNAIRDAERAAELDPRNPFVINELIESYMAVRRFTDAEHLADKAIRTSVSQNGYLWGLKSQTLIATGRIKEAAAVLEDSPLDIRRFYRTVMAAIFARDFARASQLLKNATAMEEQGTNTSFLRGLIARAELDAPKAQSSFQSARDRILRELRDRPDDPDLISNLSLADAGLGRKEDALREARRALELCPLSRDAVDAPIYQTALAQVYAWNGESDAALSELEKVVRLPQGPNYGELRFNPAWDVIRGDPRFDKIMDAAATAPVME